MKMKLGCVLTACNLNPLYSEFIPIFVRTWKKLIPDINVKIILISDSIPPEYLDYSKNIILFKPIDNISTSFTSQYIRLLYPAVLHDIDGGILITDMDMLPMNKEYYTTPIENISDDKFIHYFNSQVGYQEYAMCYNFGLSKTWSDIFEINSVEDIKERLRSVFNTRPHKDGHGNIGWNIDQLDLYKFINKWDKKNTRFIQLNVNDLNFKRLCRSQFSKGLLKHISEGAFSDYHALRPYSKYKEMNDKIYELL